MKPTSYCSKVTSCIKSRLEWSEMGLIRDITFMLRTQGWQKVLDDEQAIELPVDVEVPLENPLDTIDWWSVSRYPLRELMPS